MKDASENYGDKPGTSIRDLYPTLTEQELKEAEENLTRYVATAFEICKEQFQDADR